MIIRIEKKKHTDYGGRIRRLWEIWKFNTQKKEWEFIGAEKTLLEAQEYLKDRGIDLRTVDIVR